MILPISFPSCFYPVAFYVHKKLIRVRSMIHHVLSHLFQSHLDAQTVILANSIPLHLVASPTGHMRFRDGTHVGGWLEGAESVAQNRQQLGVLIGETEKEHNRDRMCLITINCT